MHRSPSPSLLFLLLTTFCFPSPSHAVSQDAQADSPPAVANEWNSSHARHVYGLPGAKSKETGTLRITATELIFTGRSSNTTIPLQSVIAAGAGNERVELWGMKGRLLRMAIPDGGGLFAATFMHHRVDMFTVEFTDNRAAYHAAVFFLPANEAARALQAVTTKSASPQEPAGNACDPGWVRLASVRVPVPAWNDVNVPVAYRALVYEHLVEGIRGLNGIDRVYRDGEVLAQGGCPQFTLQLSAEGFKQGNQVVRASTGPVGMFVATTQMVIEVKITNANGKEIFRDQLKATVRGESESTKVAESIAKKVVKQFAASQRGLRSVYDPPANSATYGQ
jgi:hypothetical protein